MEDDGFKARRISRRSDRRTGSTREAEEAWLRENREAIEALNREVAEFGLWCDRYRQF